MSLNVPFSPQPKGRARNVKSARTRELRRAYNQVWADNQVGGWKEKETAYCSRCRVLVMRGDGGQIDHIKPRSTHPELRAVVSNLRIVCGDCQAYYKAHPLEREP